jgi:hypothetical protein
MLQIIAIAGFILIDGAIVDLVAIFFNMMLALFQ